jgi:hypothetical protein
MEAMSVRKVFLTAPVMLLAMAAASIPAPAADLLAHRAVYELTLGNHDDSSGMISMQGGLLLEVQDGCETWTVRQRLALQITRDDGALSTTSTFDTFEAKDGSWYRFDDETFTQPGGREHASGEAVAADDTHSGRISLEEPEQSRHDLPNAAIFPMVHLADLIDRADAGERFMSHVVYDGTDGALVYDVTTVVGQAIDGDQHTAWPMRLAFFEYGGTTEQPQVEIQVTLRDDGVAESIAYEYENFVIEMALKELSELTDGGC